MATRERVRTHRRRTKNGYTTVHRHSRHGRPRSERGLVSPHHAARLAGKAWRAWRQTGRNGKRRRGRAVLLGALAFGEIGAWATMRGAGFALFTAGVLAIGVGTVLNSAAGGKSS
jgi:hypothetical protein